jgi:hypothetical protein
VILSLGFHAPAGKSPFGGLAFDCSEHEGQPGKRERAATVADSLEGGCNDDYIHLRPSSTCPFGKGYSFNGGPTYGHPIDSGQRRRRNLTQACRPVGSGDAVYRPQSASDQSVSSPGAPDILRVSREVQPLEHRPEPRVAANRVEGAQVMPHPETLGPLSVIALQPLDASKGARPVAVITGA